MAVVSVVKLSELEGAKRLDAEYYQPEYLELERKIKSQKWDYLKNLVIFNRRGIQPIYSQEPTQYRAVISQNISEDFLDIDSLPFVADDFFNSQSTQAVKINQFDILVYTTGANIGRVNIFFPKNINAIASNHVNIIRANPSKISQLYLGLFLGSKIGKYLVSKWANGSGQKEIYPEDLGNFPILIPNEEVKEYCEKILLESFKLIEKSITLYSQAETLLLTKLGLKDFETQEELFYKAKLSKMITSHRIDAEYFNPKYDEIIEKISKKAEMKPLKQFIISVKKGIEVGNEKYQDEGIPFIRVSNLSVRGLTNKDQKFINEEDYITLKDKFEPSVGEILLSKDATPGIAYFIKEPIKGIISSGILRLKIKSINPEYLCLCINSIIGRYQIEKYGGGSIIKHLKFNHIKNIVIPILPVQTQQEIAKFVIQSHETRKKAVNLLEEAKRKVEEAVGVKW